MNSIDQVSQEAFERRIVPGASEEESFKSLSSTFFGANFPIEARESSGWIDESGEQQSQQDVLLGDSNRSLMSIKGTFESLRKVGNGSRATSPRRERESRPFGCYSHHFFAPHEAFLSGRLRRRWPAVQNA